MDDVDKLITILGILDGNWDTFTKDLNNEELGYLRIEIANLKEKMETAENKDDIDNIAKNFFDSLKKVSSMEILVKLNIPDTRSGSLPESDEEVKIKLINYCVGLFNKYLKEKHEDIK
jgi:hypothetical protein